MNRSVYILIVGYRCAADIRNCLESLSLSSHAAFEVHVCENGGEEAFRELVDELASVADFAAAVKYPVRAASSKPAPDSLARVKGFMCTVRAIIWAMRVA